MQRNQEPSPPLPLEAQSESARRDETRLRALAGAVQATVYELVVDPDGSARYTFMSDGIRALLGITPEEVMADRSVLLGRVPQDQFEIVRENAERAENGGPAVSYDIQMRHVDGTAKHVRIQASMRKRADGSRVWTGVLTDVSGARHTEDALRASERMLRELTAAMPGVVYQRLVKPNGERRFVFMSEGVRTLLGVPPEQAMADPAFILGMVAAEDRELVDETRRRAVESVEPWVCEFQLRRADGERRWVRAHSTPQTRPDGSQLWTGVLIDITEARKTQEALRRVEERAELALETAADGLWDWNIKTGDVYLNPHSLRMLGYTEADGYNRIETWRTVYHPDDWPLAWGAMQDHIQGRTPMYQCERRLRHKDGHYLWVLGRGRVVARDSRGEALRMVGSNVDLTVRRAHERELRTLKFLCDNAADGFFLAEVGTARVRYVNAAACAMLGYTEAELLSMTVPDYDAHYNMPAFRAKMEELETHVRLEPLESELIRKDGSRVAVELSISMLSIDGEKLVFGAARDLSARKQAERALRESEERFRAAFEHAPVGMAMVSPDRRFTRVNAPMCELLGYTEAELLGVSVNEVTHPDDREMNRRERDRLASGEASTMHLQKRYLHREGHAVWAELSAATIRDQQGGLVGFVSHVQDITWRKRAEDDLRASEERYRAAAEGSLDSFILLRAVRDSRGAIEDFIFMDVNPRGVALIGKPRETIMGSRLCELLPVNRTHRFVDRYISVVETRQTLEEEFVMGMDPWTGRWLRHQVVPVGDGVAITTRDVTRRRQHEEELRKSVQQFQTLASLAPVGIFQCDAAGRNLYVNDELCRMFERTREEMMGDGWVRSLHPDDAERVLAAWRATVRDPREYTIEHRIIVGGRARWIAVRATVVRDARGGVESFLGTAVEITAIKEAEAQLREGLLDKQNQLRRETALRRELDHRVRNNLAALLGLISVYQRSARHPAEIGEALRGKVLAMKGVHEIIAREPGAPVGLAGLVERLADQLLVPGEVGRICISGAAIKVPPVQAGAIAMILQELFTNSRKYGALKAAEGRITIEWTASTDPSGGIGMELHWQEVNVPGVVGPRELGVGLRLIEGFAGADLRGSCRFSFDPPGLRCVLHANLDDPGEMDSAPGPHAPGAERAAEPQGV